MAGQEGGALDSHHALGRVSALGRALPVLYMSPCLPRAPWAPTFGVRCCSGGSASCSPCLGGSPSLRLASSAVGCPVPTSPFMGSWCVWLLFCCPSVNLRSAFLALLVSRGVAAAAPGLLYRSCLFLYPRPSAASFRWSVILDLSLGAPVGSSSAFPADFVSNLFRSRFLNWLILSYFLFLFSLSFCPALLPVPLLLGAFPFMDLLLATSACSHGLPLASSTPTDFDRLCLLAAHTFFLFRN